MNIKYCNTECPIGKAAAEKYLSINNSAYDAAIDFNLFVTDCFKVCPYEAEHEVVEK